MKKIIILLVFILVGCKTTINQTTIQNLTLEDKIREISDLQNFSNEENKIILHINIGSIEESNATTLNILKELKNEDFTTIEFNYLNNEEIIVSFSINKEKLTTVNLDSINSYDVPIVVDYYFRVH